MSGPDELPSADAIQREIAAHWLRLGRHLKDWGSDFDWIDDEKSADTAIAFAERSESCLLRAVMIARGQFLHPTPPESTPC